MDVSKLESLRVRQPKSLGRTDAAILQSWGPCSRNSRLGWRFQLNIRTPTGHVST
jgi:hypothetical protein